MFLHVVDSYCFTEGFIFDGPVTFHFNEAGFYVLPYERLLYEGDKIFVFTEGICKDPELINILHSRGIECAVFLFANEIYYYLP